MKRGYTLVEIVIVMAVIAALIAFIFASMAPARERARESVCIEQLHQWGRAFQMYIQEHDGIDPVKGNMYTASQLGFPPPKMIREFIANYSLKDVAHCPSARPANGQSVPYYTSYITQAFNDTTTMRNFGEVVASRGSEFPLLSCDYHNPILEFNDLPRGSYIRVIVLRLNQSVKVVRAHATGGSAAY